MMNHDELARDMINAYPAPLDARPHDATAAAALIDDLMNTDDDDLAELRRAIDHATLTADDYDTLIRALLDIDSH